MGILVANGASCLCSMGTAPSSLVVLPTAGVLGESNPAASIMDNKPMVNIMPFAMCMSLGNPQVASATAAALGVLTPMPCTPATAAPWAPGSPTVMIANNPALNNTSTVMCSYGGVISITSPGTTKTMVP